jgi:hypothetical protein
LGFWILYFGGGRSDEGHRGKIIPHRAPRANTVKNHAKLSLHPFAPTPVARPEAVTPNSKLRDYDFEKYCPWLSMTCVEREELLKDWVPFLRIYQWKPDRLTDENRRAMRRAGRTENGIR